MQVRRKFPNSLPAHFLCISYAISCTFLCLSVYVFETLFLFFLQHISAFVSLSIGNVLSHILCSSFEIRNIIFDCNACLLNSMILLGANI